MGRNRVIYQSEALFVKEMGQHASLANTDQLLRVQDISHGVELNRTDVNEFGQLAAIERAVIEPPTVSLEFSYYLHGGRNETLLGFKHTTDRSSSNPNSLQNALGNFLQNDSGKNYYISVVEEGEDNKDTATGTQQGVIGIGNGVLASYSVEAAVGGMPTASVSVEGSNLRFNDSGTSVPNPGVNIVTGADLTGTVNMPKATDTGTKSGQYDVACLRPGDVIVDFNDNGDCQPLTSTTLTNAAGGQKADKDMGGARLEGDGQMHLQNFTIDVPLARTALTRLGNKHPYAREVEVPMSMTFTCSAFLGDIENGNLNELLCKSSTERNIRVKMLKPCASSNTPSTDIAQEFLFKGATLDSQNFSASIGDNKTVDLVFTIQTSGASNTDKGLFMWQDGTFQTGEATENPDR